MNEYVLYARSGRDGRGSDDAMLKIPHPLFVYVELSLSVSFNG